MARASRVKRNYIVVKLGDGRFARYYHLTTNGVLVKDGDKGRPGS